MNEIVLLDPPGSQGVQSDGEEEGCAQEQKCLGSQEEEDEGVVRELRRDVDGDPPVEEPDFLQPCGPRDLEDREQEEPQSLPDRCPSDEPRFPNARDVRIQLVDALKA